jgi:hypothetical protein
MNATPSSTARAVVTSRNLRASSPLIVALSTPAPTPRRPSAGRGRIRRWGSASRRRCDRR